MQTNINIIISNKNEAYYLNPLNILYIEADGNYCNVFLTDGDVLNSLTVQLGEMAKLIQEKGCVYGGLFAHVGRKYIVNTQFILRIYPAKQILMLNMNDASGKKIVLHPSIKSLQEFRKGLDIGTNELVKLSREKENSMRLVNTPNAGFRAYREKMQWLEKFPADVLTLLQSEHKEEISDDECCFIGV